jgi:hypothetical protein
MPSGWCTDGDETAWRVGRLCGYLIELQEGCVCMYVVMERSQNSFCVRVTQTLICVCACDSVCVRSQNYVVRSHKLSA